MSPTHNFGAAATGQVPQSAFGVTAVVMGKTFDPMHIAQEIGKGIEAGKIVPVNMLAADVKVAPGGRPVNEIDPKLLEGTKKYVAKDDMFGAPVVAPGK